MIVPLHPDVLYLVAGQTHPEVVKEEGERYRLSLERLVRDRGLERNVQFLDRFLSMEELAFLLSSTDLYLTPYRSREQIVSGALTFAVVAGCPVVSTPYFYAEDLLASGAGVLVAVRRSRRRSPRASSQLLDNPDELAAAAPEARRIGAGLAWPSVGAMTVDVLRQAQAARHPGRGRVHRRAGGVVAVDPIRSPADPRRRRRHRAARRRRRAQPGQRLLRRRHGPAGDRGRSAWIVRARRPHLQPDGDARA